MYLIFQKWNGRFAFQTIISKSHIYIKNKRK